MVVGDSKVAAAGMLARPRADLPPGLQALLSGVSVDRLLSRDCSADALGTLDQWIARCVVEGMPALRYFDARDVAAKLPVSGDAWSRLCGYFEHAVDSICSPEPYYLLEAIIHLLGPGSLGVWLGEDVVTDVFAGLVFDKDGLAVRGTDGFELSKDGLLTRRFWLHYCPGMPGGAKTGAFLDDLMTLAPKLLNLSVLGVAPNRTVVFDRAYFYSCETKAYIRGPRGLTEDMLQAPGFPPDRTGTVTMHQRVENNPIFALSPPLLRTEFMWSERDGIKSVQIEELHEVDDESRRRGFVVNRYAHAQWDPQRRAIIHFDGALKAYRCDEYGERLATDIRKAEKKAAEYQKLVRVDAQMRLADWCRCTVKFFEENELVMEYFGGPQDRP